MLLGFGIPILLGHSEVDDVDNIGGLGVRATDEEVIGLYVTVDQILLVDCLNSRELRMSGTHFSFLKSAGKTHHLLGDHDDGLHREPSVAVIKQIFQTGTKQVNHEDIV